MRLEILTVAAALCLAVPAGAQWTTTCVRYTARNRTCSATYVAPPAPARRALARALAPAALEALADVETVDEQGSSTSTSRRSSGR
jgi:hypothetical protein